MAPHTSTAVRVEWLRQHKELWDGFNWEKLPFWQYRLEKRKVVDAMKRAGLYSPASNACDINLPKLIRLARNVGG